MSLSALAPRARPAIPLPVPPGDVLAPRRRHRARDARVVRRRRARARRPAHHGVPPLPPPPELDGQPERVRDALQVVELLARPRGLEPDVRGAAQHEHAKHLGDGARPRQTGLDARRRLAAFARRLGRLFRRAAAAGPQTLGAAREDVSAPPSIVAVVAALHGLVLLLGLGVQPRGGRRRHRAAGEVHAAHQTQVRALAPIAAPRRVFVGVLRVFGSVRGGNERVLVFVLVATVVSFHAVAHVIVDGVVVQAELAGPRLGFVGLVEKTIPVVVVVVVVVVGAFDDSAFRPSPTAVVAAVIQANLYPPDAHDARGVHVGIVLFVVLRARGEIVLVDGVGGGFGVVVGFADATAARVGPVCAEHLAVLAFGPASASKRHELGIAVLRAVQAASSAAADVAFRVRCRTTAASTASAAAAASAVASPAASTATASAPGGFMASPHPRALGNARLRLTRECRTPRPSARSSPVSGTTRGEVSGSTSF